MLRKKLLGTGQGSSLQKSHALDNMPARALYVTTDGIRSALRILCLDACDQFAMFAEDIGLPAERGWKPSADCPEYVTVTNP